MLKIVIKFQGYVLGSLTGHFLYTDRKPVLTDATEITGEIILEKKVYFVRRFAGYVCCRGLQF